MKDCSQLLEEFQCSKNNIQYANRIHEIEFSRVFYDNVEKMFYVFDYLETLSFGHKFNNASKAYSMESSPWVYLLACAIRSSTTWLSSPSSA